MIRKVEHVAIMAKDLDESIQFYSELFGFRVRATGTNPTRKMAFLYHDAMPGFEIELMQDIHPGEIYGEAGLVNHLAFTVDDLMLEKMTYEAKGIVFFPDKPLRAIDGGRTLFFKGPNQELLQFVEPPVERRKP